MGYRFLAVVVLLVAALLVAPDRPVAKADQRQPGGLYMPLASPVRAVDVPTVAAGAIQTVTLTGGGVPSSGVAAVVAQVAVGSPTAVGSVRAWATGAPNPPASAVLFPAGVPWASAQAVVRLSTAGQASFQNNSAGTIRLIVDITGYYLNTETAGGQVYVPLSNARIVDTRATSPVAANGSITFGVSGTGGLPPVANIGAVKLNITAVSPTQNGSWRVYPQGGTPQFGYGHFVGGRRQATTMDIKPPADGRLALQNVSTGTTHYLVEVVGYYRTLTTTAAGTRVYPLQPVRFLDTAGANGVPTTTPVPAQGTVTLQVTGRGGVPADATSIALMLSGRNGTVGGELIAYPSGAARPGAGNLSYPVGHYGANLVWVPLGTDGKINIYNHSTGTVHMWADAEAYGVAAQVPAAPTQASATAGNGSATVTWRASADDGGAPLAGYTVTASPGGATVNTTTTSATVSGLTNGTEYTFSVVARNGAGSSPPSARTVPVTPGTPTSPGPVTITDLYPRHNEVRVSWSDPDTGNSPITGFTVTANPGGTTVQAAANQRTAFVGGLTNGTEYTFTVAAHNAIGTSTPSPPSGGMTPQPAEAPMAPTITAAVPLNQRIDVQWVAPPDGGAPITGYRVTANPGGHIQTIAAGTTVASFTGLTNGTTYTVAVTATNLAGTSPATTRNSLVPAAARVPAAPTDLLASVPAAGQVTLRWRPPTDTGTSAITGYVVSTTPATVATPVTGTSTTLTGLTAGTEYRFTVQARNATGLGPASQPTDPLAPSLTVLKAPIVLSAQSLATLRAVHEDGVLEFEQPPTQVTGLVAGDVIASSISPQTPDGLLRKVIDKEFRDGVLLVGTVRVPVSDVVSTPGAVWSSQVSATDLADSGLRQPPGIRLATPESTENSIIYRDGAVEMNFALSPPGRKETSLSGKVTLRHDIRVELGKQRARLAVKWESEAKLRLGAFAEWKREYFGITIPLAKQEFRAGPVPVVIQEYVRLSFAVEADGSVGIEASLTAGGHHGVRGWVVENGVPGGTLIAENNPASVTLAAFYGAASLRYGPRAELGVEFYGRAGRVAGSTISMFTEFAIDTSENPYAEARVSPKITTWGGAPGIFGEKGTITKEWTVPATVVWDSGGPYVGVAVTPAHTTTSTNRAVRFTAEIIGHAGVPIVWSKVSGPGRIDGAGNYTSAEEGTAVIAARTNDPSIKEGRAEVVVGARTPDPPKNLTATGTPQSIRVAWEHPHDGGSPLLGYIVSTVPESTTVILNTPVTHTYLTSAQLKVGQGYLVRVQAINLKGLSEPATTTKEATPAGPLLRPGANVAITTDPLGNRDTLEDAGAAPVAISENGRYAVFHAQANSNIAPPEIHNPNDLRDFLLRKDLRTGEVVVASKDNGTPVPVGYPLFGEVRYLWDVSADGNTVAFAFNDTAQGRFRIYVHTISTGATWKPSDGSPATVQAAAPRLSADGRTVAFLGTSDTDVQRVYRAVVGGSPQQISKCQFLPSCEESLNSFDISGNGNRIAYEERQTGKTVVALWDSVSGYRNLIAAGNPQGSHPVISSDGTVVAVKFTYVDSTNTTRTGMAAAAVTGTIGPEDMVKEGDIKPLDANNDGRVLVYRQSTAEHDYQSRVVNRVTGAQTELGAHQLGPGFPTERYASISDNGAYVVWSGRACGELFFDTCGTASGQKPYARGWARRLG